MSSLYLTGTAPSAMAALSKAWKAGQAADARVPSLRRFFSTAMSYTGELPSRGGIGLGGLAAQACKRLVHRAGERGGDILALLDVTLGLPAVRRDLVTELPALHLARLELIAELLDLVLQPAELLELLLVGLDDALEPVVVVQDAEEGA